MPRIKSPEQKDFEDAVRGIRSSSDYSGSLDIVKEKLGLPDKITHFEIEALLITATREKFKESLDADMALMALGLLKEFPSQRDISENRSGLERITIRRRMFIEMSTYVADRHNHNFSRRTRHYESYEELKTAGEDAIKAVIKALNTEDGDAINAVAQKLYSKKGKINEYLDEAKKYLIYNKKSNIIDVKLQDLKNIRQEPPDDGNEDEPIKPNPPEPPTPEPDDMLIKITNWIKRFFRVVMVAILLLVALLLVKPISLLLARLTESPKPYSIRFSNPDEWLPFGQPKNLTVNPSPDDAALDGLRCKSEGDDAYIIEVLSEPGLHIKAIDEFDGSEPCDVNVKAYMEYDNSISDVVTIHVIKDGENEPTGEGKIHDKSSGDYSQKAD